MAKERRIRKSKQQTKINKMPEVKSPHKILERLNIPRIICVNLVGEKHNNWHRMSAGVIVMSIGVLISKVSEGYFIIHFFGEMFGYLIHGIGSIPFVEAISARLPTTDGE